MGLSNQGYSRATILTLASNPLIHFVWGGGSPQVHLLWREDAALSGSSLPWLCWPNLGMPEKCRKCSRVFRCLNMAPLSFEGACLKGPI